MTVAATPGLDGTTLSVHVPMTFRRHGGQKLVVVPDKAPHRPARPRDEPRVIKLLARAFHWKRLIDTGEYATLADLAFAEKVDRSYLGRVLRLTLLAPDIIESVLSGATFHETQVRRLLEPFPSEWERQKRWLTTEAPEALGSR